MFRTLPLMHEIERRSRALGWTWERLARELSMTRSGLAHVRAGRDRLSLTHLHRIAVWFPNDEMMRRLTWEYLLLDVTTAKERREACKEAAPDLSPQVIDQLRRYVHEFPSHVIRGTGLFLQSSDTASLAHALGFLEAEFKARAIHALREQASARVLASGVPHLLATPALFIERIEFASPSIAAVLRSRQTAAKVLVATRHVATPARDEALLAAVGSRMTTVRIDGHTTPPINA
jgi:transcriptional regulator with XRE-family HTH domain